MAAKKTRSRMLASVIVLVLVVGALALGGLTLRTASGFQPGTPAGATSGTVVSCQKYGPLSEYGVGTWYDCRAEVVEDGRPKTALVTAPYLTPADVGRQLQFDRFERTSDYASYVDYTPQGASHNNWLNYWVAVPLMIIGGLIALLAFGALVGELRGSARKKGTARRRR
jgi:hypothetical protein